MGFKKVDIPRVYTAKIYAVRPQRQPGFNSKWIETEKNTLHCQSNQLICDIEHMNSFVQIFILFFLNWKKLFQKIVMLIIHTLPFITSVIFFKDF